MLDKSTLVLFALLASLGSGCSTMGWVRGSRWSSSNQSKIIASSCSTNGESEAEAVSYDSSKLIVSGGFIPPIPLFGPPLLPVIPIPFDQAACRFEFDVHVKAKGNPVTVDFTKWQIQSNGSIFQPCQIRDGKGVKTQSSVTTNKGEPNRFKIVFPATVSNWDQMKNDKTLALLVSGVLIDGKPAPDVKLAISSLDTQFRYCALAFPGDLCEPMGRSLDCEEQ